MGRATPHPPGSQEVVPIPGPMPYNETTRPFADLSDDDRLAAIFLFNPIASVQHEGLLHEVPDGALFVYPPLLQFLILMAARVFGSQNAALKALNNPGVWDRCCDQYRRLVNKDVNVPAKPPSAPVQDRYVRRLAEHRVAIDLPDGREPDEVLIDWNSAADPLALLSTQFTRVSLGQAFRQGQFPRDAGLPDFANPDKRCSAFGDGTWLPPYSKVVPLWDPKAMTWTYSGSRVKRGKERVQDVCKRYGKIDGKSVVGINNIFIGTWTDAGRVIISARQTIRGESLTATAMVEDLIAHLGDRLHTVVWDKALSGRVLHQIAARHKVAIITKPVARSKGKEHRTSDGHTAREITAEMAFQAHRRGRALPLGTTVQWVSGDRTMIRSKFHHFRPLPEAVRTCRRDHALWVDGGVLWDTYTDPNDGTCYKHKAARATSAVPVQVETLLEGDVATVWEVPIHWDLDCADAEGGIHQFTTLWEPLAIAGGRPANGPQRPMHDLRPLGVEDQRFWDIFGSRNNAESVNAWYKATLKHKGHAMRQRSREQYVDQVAASFTMNAITWWTHRRQGALKALPEPSAVVG